MADERRAVDAFKKTALMVFGLAMQTYGQKLADQQEVLMNVADIMIDVFSAESAVLRALAQGDRTPRAALHVDAARVFVNDAAMRIDASARQALAAMTEGDTLRTMLAALRRLLKFVADRYRDAAAAARRRGGRAWRLHLCVNGSRARWWPERAACASKPPDDSRDYAAKVAADRAAKDAAFLAGNDPIPKSRHDQFLPLAYFPDRTGLQRPGRAQAEQRPDDHRDADVDGHQQKDAARRHAGIRPQGAAAEADGVERGRRGSQPPVRAVQRSDQRNGDVRGGPIHGSQPQRHGDLRDGLQPRVHPVLLLQPDVRVSVPAAGKPA